MSAHHVYEFSLCYLVFEKYEVAVFCLPCENDLRMLTYVGMRSSVLGVT